MDELQVLDSIVGRLNFIMIKMLSLGSKLDMEVLVSLAKEMLPEYGIDEKDPLNDKVPVFISDMCNFCDTIQNIIEGSEVDEENETAKLGGKTIKVC